MFININMIYAANSQSPVPGTSNSSRPSQCSDRTCWFPTTSLEEVAQLFSVTTAFGVLSQVSRVIDRSAHMCKCQFANFSGIESGSGSILKYTVQSVLWQLNITTWLTCMYISANAEMCFTPPWLWIFIHKSLQHTGSAGQVCDHAVLVVGTF